MWGHICSELVNQYNFNVSFSTHKAETLIHLSQWQYWWWFWFSFFWTFYFFVIIRVIKHRVFKMGLRLNTSLRSRGKWGDYLVTLIPLSWCMNILLNSNFILRMIEWQAEAGTLIIRIHGKQWYWVYKYDLSNVFGVMNTPKILGNGKWFSFFLDGKYNQDNYLQQAQIKLNTLSRKEYNIESNLKNFNPTSTFSVFANTFEWNTNKVISKRQQFNINYYTPENKTKANILSFLRNEIKQKKQLKIFTPLVPQEPATNTNINFSKLTIKKTKNTPLSGVKISKQKTPLNNFLFKSSCLDLNLRETDYKFSGYYFAANKTINNLRIKAQNQLKTIYATELPVLPIENPSIKSLFTSASRLKNKTKDTTSFYENNAIDDSWEVYANMHVLQSEKPVTIQKSFINSTEANKTSLFFLKFYNSNENVVEKPDENIDFLVVKQKRYKRKQGYKLISVQDGNTTRFLKNNLIFTQISKIGANDAFSYYSSFKLNRKRAETFSINLSRRLLRTTRTLVLPAYTNITIIANSYDVVHSWFIPGLGLKMDCVPGKSTHHSLYIDNVGLYYGQCAEICGRYHHHMPIRICAIPFEQFLVWWLSKGLPKSLKMRYDAKKIDDTLKFKYVW